MSPRCPRVYARRARRFFARGAYVGALWSEAYRSYRQGYREHPERFPLPRLDGFHVKSALHAHLTAPQRAQLYTRGKAPWQKHG